MILRPVRPASAAAALPTGGFVILDTALDDDLLAEGYARDAIRAVQDARKAADLDIADRIVFCQIFVGRFGVSFSPFERLFLGRFGFGQSCGLSVIA